jgi:AmmeMemoRadiSam system protein A
MDYCRLARESLHHWLLYTAKLSVSREAGMRAGCFVSLHDGDGDLRGCIGTIEPTTADLTHEIVDNAIASGTRDHRFSPVVLDEMDNLQFEVHVLHPPEPVTDESSLDPKHYGVIVANGPRRGVLLPDLEGVDTVARQLAITRRKAYIGEDEPVQLWRFQVEKFYEHR